MGGTGVVTIGALIGMAAHLEGKGTTVLDQTGLAQKGGAVTCHVRIAKAPLEKVAAESLPFLLWQIAVLGLVTYIPFIATGLPQYFGYGR